MIAHTLRSFLEAKWRWRYLQGERLEQFQNQKAGQMVAWVAQHSPFYRRHWQGHNLDNWRELPTVSKTEMMAHFAEFNTLGMERDAAQKAALRAEQERDFRPTLNGATVGLSSGTSGQRGLFVVSPTEQAAWAGVILSRLLHQFHPSGERVAFFLRANSNLYESVRRGRWLQFRYLDLLTPLPEACATLGAFQPTILVAPPSMLERLAGALHSNLHIRPRQVISVAEILEPQDKARLEAAFGVPLHQVYQATEGLLGISCRKGHLHIQEDIVAMQLEDIGGGRVTPILTDLWRKAQPIVHYRLGDVLRVRTGRCECGSDWRVIEQHEGRMGDVLQFETGKLYLEDMRRILFSSPAPFDDYHLEQDAPGHLRVFLQADAGALPPVQTHLEQTFAAMGLKLERLELRLGLPEQPAHIKRRRLRGRPQ